MGTRRQSEKFVKEFYDEFEFEWSIFRAIKETREKRGLSQRDLAKKINVEQTAMARLESGRVNSMLEFLKKVMTGLDLELKVCDIIIP